MAKLFGPLFCNQVSGSVGKMMTYGKNSMGSYCYAYALHKDANTIKQRTIRQYVLDAIQVWKENEQKLREAWSKASDNKNRTGYHAFMHAYLRSRFLGLTPKVAPGAIHFNNYNFDKRFFGG